MADMTQNWKQRALAAETDARNVRSALIALRTAVEADYKCQGVDPRNVGDAHTWVALAMKGADKVLD